MIKMSKFFIAYLFVVFCTQSNCDSSSATHPKSDEEDTAEVSQIEKMISQVLAEIGRVDDQLRFLETTIQELMKIIADILASIQKVESEQIRVGNDTSKVKSEISDVKSKISSVQFEIPRINSLKESYLSDAKTYQSEHEEWEKKKVGVKREISDLLQIQHKLQVEVDLKTKESSSVLDFNKDILKFSESHSNFLEQNKAVLDAISKLQTAHVQWILDFKQLMKTFAPDFPSVKDMPSYKKAQGNVLKFREKILSLNTLKSEEDALIKQIKAQIEAIRKEQTTLRTFVLKPGFTVFSAYRTATRNIETLKNFDKFLDEYYHGLHRAESLILEERKKRNYLLEAVPSLWNRLLKANLLVSSVEVGVDLTKQAAIGLRGDEIVYGNLKSDLANRRSQFLKALYTDLTPIHARRLAIEAREFLQNSEVQIRKMDLAVEFRPYIEDLLGKYKDLFDTDISDAQKISNKPEAYFKERKRATTLYTNRYSHKFSDQCKGLSKQILEYSKNNLQSESDYIAFRSTCL